MTCDLRPPTCASDVSRTIPPLPSFLREGPVARSGARDANRPILNGFNILPRRWTGAIKASGSVIAIPGAQTRTGCSNAAELRVFVELDPGDMDPGADLRIWRLRKRNLYVDAELRHVPETGEWDVLVYYGTTLTSSRRCATRAEAVGAAKARRAELEREGWTFHW